MNKIMKNTAQEMKFSIKDFLSKCDQIRSGEILNGKLHFLCSEITWEIITALNFILNRSNRLGRGLQLY